jgi:hypothetical protein
MRELVPAEVELGHHQQLAGPVFGDQGDQPIQVRGNVTRARGQLRECDPHEWSQSFPVPLWAARPRVS